MVVNLFFFVDLFLLKGFNLSFKIIAHAFISMIKFIHFFLVILRTFYHLSFAHLSFLRMLLLNFLLFFLLFLNVVHFLSHKFIHFFLYGLFSYSFFRSRRYLSLFRFFSLLLAVYGIFLSFF